jgi:hypothetical protein
MKFGKGVWSKAKFQDYKAYLSCWYLEGVKGITLEDLWCISIDQQWIHVVVGERIDNTRKGMWNKLGKGNNINCQGESLKERCGRVKKWEQGVNWLEWGKVVYMSWEQAHSKTETHQWCNGAMV